MLRMRFWPITARPISAISAVGSMILNVPVPPYRSGQPLPEQFFVAVLLTRAQNFAVGAGKGTPLEILPRFPMAFGVVSGRILRPDPKCFQSDPVARNGVLDHTQWLEGHGTESEKF